MLKGGSERQVVSSVAWGARTGSLDLLFFVIDRASCALHRKLLVLSAEGLERIHHSLG